MPRFRAKPLEFEAVQLRQAIEIRAGKGRPVVHGKPGDWLRIFDDGAQDVVTSAQLAAGFERVNGSPPTVATAPPATFANARTLSSSRAATPPKPGPGQGKRPSKLTDEQWAHVRIRWEAGEKLTAIAKWAGITPQGVTQRAKRDKWARPKAGTTAPKGEPLAGRVRCHACELMTGTDPCENCGKPLKRTWK